MKDRRIRGFLIVRNVVEQGYPFVEAVCSMMALCDAVHVLDGESTDDTWSVLSELRDLCGADRLVLHREAWRRIDGQHPFRAATNQLLERVEGEWLFNFQANEILPGETAAEILGLFGQYPGVDLFRLPYLHAMGMHYAYTSDRRGRLFRKAPHLECIGDAYDCGIDFWRNRARPWRLPGLVLGRLRFRPVPLQRPILRLRAVCPESYVAKLRTQASTYFPFPAYAAERDAAEAALRRAREAGESVDAFWERIRFGRPQGDDRERVPIAEKQRLTDLPPIIRHLAGRWEYDARAALEAAASLGVPAPF